MSINQTLKLYLTSGLLLLSYLWSPVALAQVVESNRLKIVDVDLSQLPAITLKLVTDGVLADGQDTITVTEAGEKRFIEAVQSQTNPRQVAVLIDPVRAQEELSPGESRHAFMMAGLRKLVEQGLFVRHIDRLSAFTLSPVGEPVIIQDWISEPNLIYNMVAQYVPASVPQDALADEDWSPMIADLDREYQQTNADLVVIFFASGYVAIPAEVSEWISERQGQLHVLEFQNENADDLVTGQLADAAQSTGGFHVINQDTEKFAQIIAQLSDRQQRYTVTYRSALGEQADDNAIASQEVEIGIEATWPDGSVSSNSVQVTIPQHHQLSEPMSPTSISTVAGENVSAAPQIGDSPADNSRDESSEVSNNGQSAASATITSNMIIIPILNMAIPRSVLQVSLPLLILLIGYLVYTDQRERRLNRSRSLKGANAIGDAELHSSLDALAPDDFQQPQVPAPRASVHAEEALDDQLVAPGDSPSLRELDNFRPLYQAEPRRLPETDADSLPPMQEDQPVEKRPGYDDQQLGQPSVSDDDGEATMAPALRFGDEDATYRLSDKIEVPIIGNLMRVTRDPRLPQKLSVYGLHSGYGGERQIYIGRHSQNNTIIINDKSVSREHAVIVQKSGRLYIRDNASTAGTYLNGKRLEAGEELLLRNNDLLSFGEIVYEFRAQGEDEATIAGD